MGFYVGKPFLPHPTLILKIKGIKCSLTLAITWVFASPGVQLLNNEKTKKIVKSSVVFTVVVEARGLKRRNMYSVVVAYLRHSCNTGTGTSICCRGPPRTRCLTTRTPPAFPTSLGPAKPCPPAAARPSPLASGPITGGTPAAEVIEKQWVDLTGCRPLLRS